LKIITQFFRLPFDANISGINNGCWHVYLTPLSRTRSNKAYGRKAGCALRGTAFLFDVAAKKNKMTEEEENQIETSEPKPFSGHNLNRILAILFVLGIHLIIFLKILVLE
jgi:hypothetical protein